MKTQGVLGHVLWLAVGTVACGGGDAPGDEPPPYTSSGGSTSSGALPFGCDASRSPSEDPCVLNEALGVFVSSSLGAEGADGSRAKPFAELGAAVAAAQAQGKARVYVCAEAYTSSETLELVDGVSVYGALSCAGGQWSASDGLAVLKSSATPSVRAVAIARETWVRNLRVEAAEGTAERPSSIAMVTSEAAGLTLEQVELLAGAGAKGKDSVTPPAMTVEGNANGTTGYEGSDVCTRIEGLPFSYSCERAPTGGTGGQVTCRGEGGVVEGNPGGDGGRGAIEVRGGTGYAEAVLSSLCLSGVNCRYSSGEDGLPLQATSATSQGGVVVYPSLPSTVLRPVEQSIESFPPVAATAGARGAAAKPSTKSGSFSLAGYHEPVADRGHRGGAGQGGGGGNGSGRWWWDGPYAGIGPIKVQASLGTYWGGHGGGGGGGGGCPGEPASAASGGGASVALASFGALPKVVSGRLVAASGGAGGEGAAGGPVGQGGEGGRPAAKPFVLDLNKKTLAHAGAKGGDGGKAGISQSAVHGPSIAWAYADVEPALSDAVTLEAAAPVPSSASRQLDGQTLAEVPEGVAGTVVKIQRAAAQP